jgi:hypothetical protein
MWWVAVTVCMWWVAVTVCMWWVAVTVCIWWVAVTVIYVVSNCYCMYMVSSSDCIYVVNSCFMCRLSVSLRYCVYVVSTCNIAFAVSILRGHVTNRCLYLCDKIRILCLIVILWLVSVTTLYLFIVVFKLWVIVISSCIFTAYR